MDTVTVKELAMIAGATCTTVRNHVGTGDIPLTTAQQFLDNYKPSRNSPKASWCHLQLRPNPPPKRIVSEPVSRIEELEDADGITLDSRTATPWGDLNIRELSVLTGTPVNTIVTRLYENDDLGPFEAAMRHRNGRPIRLKRTPYPVEVEYALKHRMPVKRVMRLYSPERG